MPIPLRALLSLCRHKPTHPSCSAHTAFSGRRCDTAEPVAAACLLAGLLAVCTRRPVLHLVEIGVVTPSTWHSLDADLRSFIEVYLLAVIILLGALRRSLGAQVLPSLAALTLPALIAVTQRRLTLS